MFSSQIQRTVSALALAAAVGLGGFAAHADDRYDRYDRRGRDDDHRVKKVFVIAMENHNWTQPSSVTDIQPIFKSTAAPFINSLVNGTSGYSNQVAYANGYINAAAGVHPSEPNYIWAEAGANFGVANDDDPYHADCTPDTIQSTTQHLTAYLEKAGKSWRSYQEDTDVSATNAPLPSAQWTVPLSSMSGKFTAPGGNPYNYSNQYNYAAKHNPFVFFADSAGGCNRTSTNTQAHHYAPLQQLTLDLANNNVADYTWITPDQYNDMHSTLANGYGQYANASASSDSANVATGDNFLARVVPLIMQSQAYQDGGAIFLWWDESEGGDTSAETIPFIVISKYVRPNVNGVPYSNTIKYTHSSDLRTKQEVFHVDPDHGYAWLGDAANALDLSDLFQNGALR